MEKEGAKTVPIAYSDDKRQLTAFLAVSAPGEYLPPLTGKDSKCHPRVSFPEGWDAWHSNKITTKQDH